MNPPFDRTICACSACSAYCRRQPGPLAPGELEELTAFLVRHHGLTEDTARRLFRASPGAVLANTDTGTVVQVGTITPARKPDGSCVFLTEDGRCGVHEVAPFGCAFLDAHFGEADGQRRSLWLHRQIMRSAGYQLDRQTLERAQ